MTNLEKLIALHRAAELALLNGADRDILRKCAGELQEFIKAKEAADAPAPK